ncbi:iron-containing alcohol dehydrogenase [Frisingicoccus caecimuris]|uniref:Glycerol-1-phosphate dehydrogenase [NAD(P)+] n=1 Tax=Frisingicoccus caecimuris TaxID=1796636 RepID=A0A4R2LWS3_9FIRM|nr:iron-containing alcohol dehydrogenase [Frisingicoccus caecimuris]MCR1919135.1 iron-containing alcohol dehydrogenase [Frisingicoccus caecimuris]TCO84611.1 glycerol-1-phosphate dehydrogenase [NAD(P)+] [Frisingicoccus caecimuris]
MKINLGEISSLCGKDSENHPFIRGMWIEPGAISKIKGIMQKEGWQEPVIICDQNTYFAGDLLLENMDNYDLICLDPEDLAADERSVSLAQNKIPATADCMIALGSVTIHDITRYLSWQYHLPFISVPTAASGEGYTTCISAVVRKGVKGNVIASAPTYLFADTDIFAAVPQRLTAAGFSDLMGNYIALADAQISAVVTGSGFNHELYHTEVMLMQQVIEQIDNLAAGDPSSCEQLLYALILPDMEIGFYEAARPLMGAEHHLSRYLDISVKQPKLNAVHGEKVGVGTLLCLKAYESFRTALEKRQLIPVKHFPSAAREIQKGFQDEEVCASVASLNTPDPMANITSEQVLQHRKEILDILGELPSAVYLETCFQKMGCKIHIEELGIQDNIIREAMTYAPYVSRDITLLRLMKLFENF